MGLRSLHLLEKADLVRRVIPLKVSRREEAVQVLHGAVGRMALSVPEEEGPSPLEGGILVELQSEENADWLRRRLAEDPDVESVSRVPIRYLLAPLVALATPPPLEALWNLEAIEWAAARALPKLKEGASRTIAILDTGIDANHPDLAPHIASYVHTYPDPANAVNLEAGDIVGHGTHVSGTISALANNRFSVDRAPAGQIHAYKIFQDQATALVQTSDGSFHFTYAADPQTYLLALDDCLKRGIDVINLSFGGPEPPEPTEQQLFEALLRRGTVIVAAMGNDGLAGSPSSYPAATPGVVAVGASRQDDSIAGFSSRGAHISLCAPGVAIWSTLPTYPGNAGFQAIPTSRGGFKQGAAISRETDYDSWSGTSMATPHVSGAVALLLANRGSMSPADVKKRLESSAERVAGLGTRSFDSAYGHGRLNLRRLLKGE